MLHVALNDANIPEVNMSPGRACIVEVRLALQSSVLTASLSFDQFFSSF